LPDKINDVLRKTLVYNTKETSVFLIGSTSSMGSMLFNAKLSDTDLLIISNCRSIGDYVESYRQALSVSSALNEGLFGSVDVFPLTEHIVSRYFSCLSVLAGSTSLNNHEPLFGRNMESSMSHKEMPSALFRKKLYCAEALRLSRKSQEMLPMADTARTRQVIKEVTRALKVFICAVVPLAELESTEEKLFSIKDLRTLKTMVDDVIAEPVPIGPALAVALEVDKIADWSQWMVDQVELSYWFAEVESYVLISEVKERKFFESIVQVRNMLLPEMRNIFFEKDADIRSEVIGRYADEAAATIAQLGLLGVPELLDFTTDNTPQIIQQSYEILVEHLQERGSGFRCLAAAVILLEFSLQCAIDRDMYLNQ